MLSSRELSNFNCNVLSVCMFYSTELPASKTVSEGAYSSLATAEIGEQSKPSMIHSRRELVGDLLLHRG